MWDNLFREIEAQKKAFFGAQYDRYAPIADSFLELLSHLLSKQDANGMWADGNEFNVVLTAHMLRLLRGLGVSLQDRWNPQPENRHGNLERTVEQLLRVHHEPSRGRPAHWGEDFWDDCYILLALREAEGELDETLKATYDEHRDASLAWLRQKVDEGLDRLPAGEWYGPGFHAAAIVLFDRLDEPAPLGRVANDLAALLTTSRTSGGPVAWHKLFAWHVGQVVVAWKKHRGRRPALSVLDDLVTSLYAELISPSRRSKNGAWDNGGAIDRLVDIIYCTVRGLQACYAMEADPAACPAIVAAQTFLLEHARQDRPLQTLKACVNALEAYQELFQCRLQPTLIHLVLATSAAARLDSLGLSGVLEEPRDRNETLLEVRRVARRELERGGCPALEPLGVNAILYEHVRKQAAVVREFEGDAPAVRKRLHDFLSATMTEVRCDLARDLIADLWRRQGLFNFLPFIQRLSDLELNRSFFSRYRDHVNHQVLFFLLGTYLYYRCAPLRRAVDDEIFAIGEQTGVPCPSTEEEFLFRWKLIATFHDVGYLFEVDPDVGEAAERASKKARLIQESIQVLDEFGQSFLLEYLARSLQEDGARRLLTELGDKVKPDGPRVRSLEDLYSLRLFEKETDTFGLISRRVAGARIGKDLIRNYFDLCRAQAASAHRKEFYDHGIMSALILLKTAEIQRHYLTQLNRCAVEGELTAAPGVLRVLKQARERGHLAEEQFYLRFAHVAAASALHNIYPRLYSLDQCRPLGLDTAFYSAAGNGFAIRLEDNALSCLAAMVDVLQDWDRHSFRAPTFAASSDRIPDPISASEVLIAVCDGKIQVVPLSAAAATRYRAHLDELRQTIKDDAGCIELHDPHGWLPPRR